MPSLPATLIETEAEIQKAEERYHWAETPQAALNEAFVLERLQAHRHRLKAIEWV